MARKIEVDLTADTKSFERGMDSSAKAVDKLDDQLGKASKEASRFDDGLDKVGDGLETSTSKFRSTADLAGGLGDVLGVQAAGPIASYAMGFADIADGLGGLLAPALQKAKGAFLAMNATLLANPIFLVIAALAALTAAFVIAYKKSETFRAVVDKSVGFVKAAVVDFGHAVEDVTVGAARKLARLADIITTPYQVAFKAIASLWNNTVGKLHVSIPGFLGFGGVSFDVPDIPEFARGGRPTPGQPALVGERGPEVWVPDGAGTIIPNNRLGGGGVTVMIQTGASDLDELIRKRVRVLGGGNVQTAFGR